MKVEANRVVALRFIIKNDKGEIIEDIMNKQPVEYLHGAGNVLPSLEAGVEGMQTGEKKLITFKNGEDMNEGYEIDIIIDSIRQATNTELKQGKPEDKSADNEICGPGCCC